LSHAGEEGLARLAPHRVLRRFLGELAREEQVGGSILDGTAPGAVLPAIGSFLGEEVIAHARLR
jgi:hypothetical protein